MQTGPPELLTLPKPSTGPAKPELEAAPERRLFAEHLALGLEWMKLKRLFRGRYKVIYADVVEFMEDEEAYGIIEFGTSADALKACRQFNGVLLENKTVRLRQDRGEFLELKALKMQLGKAPKASCAAVPVPTPPSPSRKRARHKEAEAGKSGQQ